jgi:general secretion pathway protein J
MSRTGPRGGQAGFTLIEILIALAVLGLVLSGLAEGTRYGLRVWDRQVRLIESRDQLDAADRTLRRLIAQMDVGGDPTPAAPSGTADHFDFTTWLPRALALSTRRADVTLKVDSDHRLMLRWRDHLHETRFAGPPPAEEAELLAGVRRIDFSYWRPADRQGNPAGWRKQWTDPTPPPLVKIHLDFTEGDPRHWPDIVAGCDRDLFDR